MKMSYEEYLALIGKMTESEVHEVLSEAHFFGMSTEEWLNSSMAEEFRQRIMKR